MHGVNIVPKTYPYIPSNTTEDPEFSLTDKEIDDLAKWGFNVVRLGIMWQSVETAPNVYNSTYLDEMDALITKLGQRGIYSLVDGHQDALSNYTCGEGFPNFYVNQAKDYCDGGIIPWLIQQEGLCWSIKSYNFREDKDGNPYVDDCRQHGFTDYYLTAESLDFFGSLYTKTSVQDQWVEFWKVVSNRIGRNPYVVGYDPINEPFPSSYFKDPEFVFVPGSFDH